MENIGIIFYILSGVSFLFSIYFFYLAKVKKLEIKECLKIDKSTGLVIRFDNDEGTMGMIAPDAIIGKYKISDVVNTINSFIFSFNKKNKRVNIASAIISIIASIGYFVSAILLN